MLRSVSPGAAQLVLVRSMKSLVFAAVLLVFVSARANDGANRFVLYHTVSEPTPIVFGNIMVYNLAMVTPIEFGRKEKLS